MIIDYVPGCVGAVVDVDLVTGDGVFVSIGAEDECSNTS